MTNSKIIDVICTIGIVMCGLTIIGGFVVLVWLAT
jgi:hypothetical protein